MFVLFPDEAYAGTSISEWKLLSLRVEILKPVKLDDIEPENQQCDICQESFSPSEDGTSQEKPVSLPCGHVFGKECIAGWMADSHGNSAVRLETTFTCPKCRTKFTDPISEVQAPKIESRLRFWDLVYEKLGILRSVEEEECRKCLWRFVEEQKTEQNKKNWDLWRPRFDFLAQQSGLRIALQCPRWDLIPMERQACDAIFNFACYGVNDPSEEYCAESYEDRRIPTWCWQFEQISLGRSTDFSLFERLGRDGSQPCIGPWRRAMFTRTENDVRARNGLDSTLWAPNVLNLMFSVLNETASIPNE